MEKADKEYVFDEEADEIAKSLKEIFEGISVVVDKILLPHWITFRTDFYDALWQAIDEHLKFRYSRRFEECECEPDYYIFCLGHIKTDAAEYHVMIKTTEYMPDFKNIKICIDRIWLERVYSD